MIKDSGERTVYDNGFQRDMHEGKGRFDLLPWGAIWELAKLCEEGAIKYGERNIDLGCPQHSLLDSAIRHIAKHIMGFTDEDHLRAAFWNLGWALQQNVYRPDMLDIPPMKIVERCDEDEKVEAVMKELLTPYEEAAMTLSDAISELARKDHAERFWENK